MMRQLPLAVGLKDNRNFETYQVGPNREAVDTLMCCAWGRGERHVYIWGPPGVGKSHLLQAACRHAGEFGIAAVYLPLGQASELPVTVLEALENVPLVCLDDIHCVAGQCAWEIGLFNLFNRVRSYGDRLLIAGRSAPTRLGLKLTDLSSRLGWGLVFQLHDLDDEQKLKALQARAKVRGLALPRHAGCYLLRHYPRDMASLFALLERLDRASLTAQRRLTVPFIRRVLKQASEEYWSTAHKLKT
jgi:DnaA regulatory inactivator Hda